MDEGFIFVNKFIQDGKYLFIKIVPAYKVKIN
jgi:hypothetical protein